MMYTLHNLAIPFPEARVSVKNKPFPSIFRPALLAFLVPTLVAEAGTPVTGWTPGIQVQPNGLLGSTGWDATGVGSPHVICDGGLHLVIRALGSDAEAIKRKFKQIVPDYQPAPSSAGSQEVRL
jgi:hypothetical protein